MQHMLENASPYQGNQQSNQRQHRKCYKNSCQENQCDGYRYSWNKNQLQAQQSQHIVQAIEEQENQVQRIGKIQELNPENAVIRVGIQEAKRRRNKVRNAP